MALHLQCSENEIPRYPLHLKFNLELPTSVLKETRGLTLCLHCSADFVPIGQMFCFMCALMYENAAYDTANGPLVDVGNAKREV